MVEHVIFILLRSAHLQNCLIKLNEITENIEVIVGHVSQNPAKYLLGAIFQVSEMCLLPSLAPSNIKRSMTPKIVNN